MRKPQLMRALPIALHLGGGAGHRSGISSPAEQIRRWEQPEPFGRMSAALRDRAIGSLQ